MATNFKHLSTQTLTSGGTAQAVSSTSVKVQSVLIQADLTNAGKVYIGHSTVSSTNGLELSAGDAITITAPEVGKGGSDSFDLTDIYWDGTTGYKIRVAYQVRPT